MPQVAEMQVRTEEQVQEAIAAAEARKQARAAFGETAAERDAEAFKRREAGATWAQIAVDMGYANGAVARRAALRHGERATN